MEYFKIYTTIELIRFKLLTSIDNKFEIKNTYSLIIRGLSTLVYFNNNVVPNTADNFLILEVFDIREYTLYINIFKILNQIEFGWKVFKVWFDVTLGVSINDLGGSFIFVGTGEFIYESYNFDKYVV